MKTQKTALVEAIIKNSIENGGVPTIKVIYSMLDTLGGSIIYADENMSDVERDDECIVFNMSDNAISSSSGNVYDVIDNSLSFYCVIDDEVVMCIIPTVSIESAYDYKTGRGLNFNITEDYNELIECLERKDKKVPHLRVVK